MAALTEAFESSRMPPMMLEPARVVSISFGDNPPELAFDSIQHVDTTRAHVIFLFRYAGNASLTLRTTIQANPLRDCYQNKSWPCFVRPKVVGADTNLTMPFFLRLTNIVLESYVDIVYTREGVVINFRDNPVKRAVPRSSLDIIPGVQRMISQMLLSQLCDAFFEDIPEAVWKMTSKKREEPDPFFGARRWSQQHQSHVRFSELGVRRPPVAHIAPFNSLALDLTLPDTVLAVPAKGAARIGSRSPAPADRVIDVADLFCVDTASESSCSSTTSAPSFRMPRTDWSPRKRMFSWKKLRSSLSLRDDTDDADIDAQATTPQIGPPVFGQLRKAETPSPQKVQRRNDLGCLRTTRSVSFNSHRQHRVSPTVETHNSET